MPTSPTRPPIGATAPEVHLRDEAGNDWRLDGHLGQTVVLILHRHIH